MAANKVFKFGPLALTNTFTTNILNPATATGGVNAGSSPNYIILKHVRIVEVANVGANVRLYKGLTGANTAGTETLFPKDYPVAAKGFIEWFGINRFESTDFLVGGASAATTLTIEGEGEIGVAG